VEEQHPTTGRPGRARVGVGVTVRRGQDAATAASAAVFVAGSRQGSAVLVTERLLLTAGHVLDRADADSEITVEFPAVPPGEPVPARALPAAETAPGPRRPDVAVLELLDPPSWLPDPVELQAGRRRPRRVQVFGFPGEERELVGVWRDFEVAGPVAGTPAVQLDWPRDAGSLRGHSGGAILDTETGTIAGVLVEGSERGRFDRYTPVRAAQPWWPALPRPWLVIAPEGRDHFERRARGQRGSRRHDEDLFRGRDAARPRRGNGCSTPTRPAPRW
jgi:trypsin-like peptidase